MPKEYSYFPDLAGAGSVGTTGKVVLFWGDPQVTITARLHGHDIGRESPPPASSSSVPHKHAPFTIAWQNGHIPGTGFDEAEEEEERAAVKAIHDSALPHNDSYDALMPELQRGEPPVTQQTSYTKLFFYGAATLTLVATVIAAKQNLSAKL